MKQWQRQRSVLIGNILVTGIEHPTSNPPWLPSKSETLGWRSQRFLCEVEAIGHIVGSLISCIQWLQPKRNF